jgi:hypothetical protein
MWPGLHFVEVTITTQLIPDGERLLAECEMRGIEGIGSMRKDAPYRSGKCEALA